MNELKLDVLENDEAIVAVLRENNALGYNELFRKVGTMMTEHNKTISREKFGESLIRLQNDTIVKKHFGKHGKYLLTHSIASEEFQKSLLDDKFVRQLEIIEKYVKLIEENEQLQKPELLQRLVWICSSLFQYFEFQIITKHIFTSYNKKADDISEICKVLIQRLVLISMKNETNCSYAVMKIWRRIISNVN